MNGESFGRKEMKDSMNLLWLVTYELETWFAKIIADLNLCFSLFFLDELLFYKIASSVFTAKISAGEAEDAT